MKKRRGAVFLLALTLLLTSGCQGSAPKPYAYLDTDFTAELSGSLYGHAFTLKLTVRKDDASGSAEPLYSVTAAYLSPSPLASLQISAQMDGQGNCIGEIGITYGELRTDLPADALAGLLLPIRTLLVPEEIASLQKESTGYCFTLKNGALMMQSNSGLPLSFSSPTLSFDVVWWETALVP